MLESNGWECASTKECDTIYVQCILFYLLHFSFFCVFISFVRFVATFSFDTFLFDLRWPKRFEFHFNEIEHIFHSDFSFVSHSKSIYFKTIEWHLISIFQHTYTHIYIVWYNSLEYLSPFSLVTLSSIFGHFSNGNCRMKQIQTIE